MVRRADAEGLVVIDDPESILRCTNKVYLAELLNKNMIPGPKTVIIRQDNRHQVPDFIGFPCILKQPDSSWSNGVIKVDNADDYERKSAKLFEKSELLIGQEFIPTSFDWRVGILNQQPLYVCRYYMARFDRGANEVRVIVCTKGSCFFLKPVCNGSVYFVQVSENCRKFRINRSDDNGQMKKMNAQWLDTTEYPFKSHFFEVDGYNLHYIDEGEGPVILFVHGTPSWSFEYRNVIKALRGSFRCIAVDHMGFGLSDKPETYNYSTLHHSRSLELFIRAKNLKDITLVVHDFGGPIGLNTAIRYPEKFKSFVILNSWLWSSVSDPEFIRFSKILKSPLLPLLYRYLNFSPRFILPKSFGDRKLSSKMRKQYTRPFARISQRNGPLAFARSLLNDQEWFEELWNKRDAISDKPVLFIWGMKDPVITPKNLEKFMSGFHRSRSVILETSGHFPQEEQPEIVSKAIQDFLLK